MDLRIVTLAALLSLVCSTRVYSQDRQEGKTRRIIMYDNEVTVPRPSGPAAAIYRYWDYFFIAAGVRDYIMNTDSTRDCLTILDAAFFTVPDTVTSDISFGMEHANIAPAGPNAGFADYLLYGMVNGQTVTLKLETGKTRELVKSGSINLPQGFDPLVVGKAAAAFIGPIYTTILDFEKRKRDQGEPYAIEPKIILIPSKEKLKANEKTDIDVLLKDYDGAPLKRRHITFRADGGVLKSSEITTDDQGRGRLEFTAGPDPALGSVTSDYPFELPTGYTSVANVEAASIQIDKPNDYWYINAKYQMSNTHTNTKEGSYSGATEKGLSVSKDWTDIMYSAWVKNINPVAGRFTCDPANIVIKIHGSSGEYSYLTWHWENAAGYIDDKENSVANAVVAPSPAVKLNISILPNSYAFSVSNVMVTQNGIGQQVRRSQVKGMPVEIISGETKPNPETTLSLSVHDVARDTTYMVTETSDVGGIKTVMITSVSQKYSWKNNTCNLTYKQIYSEDTRSESPIKDYSRWDQTYTVSFYMSYTGDPPTGVEAGDQAVPTSYTLNQNYPNPFNPTTTISYVLAASTHATLIITDILGRHVATLVDEERSAGVHAMSWNASGLPSGVYFLQMRAGGFVETRKLLLAK